MARGALRGATTAVLSLVALQGLVSAGGSGRVGGLLADANRLLTRALDPKVPAIPDRKAAKATPTTPSAVTTGQASWDGSSGHQIDPTPRIPIPTN